jgi:predicted ATPase
MKLLTLAITGVRDGLPPNLDFFDDVNLFTGMNGSGKTTLLKILWYIISGNCERLYQEVRFASIHLETTLYAVLITCPSNPKDGYIEWSYTSSDKSVQSKGQVPVGTARADDSAFDILNNLLVDNKSSSVFFPTFRRIEGGYSTTKQEPRGRVHPIPFAGMAPVALRSVLQSHAELLSVRNHRFVCAISTYDIEQLVTKRYAALSENLNTRYAEFTESILKELQTEPRPRDLHAETGPRDHQGEVFHEIKRLADEINSSRTELLRPFESLTREASSMLGHPSIKFGSRDPRTAIALGASVQAIDSDLLSAGEKQLLGFLCYNAFSDESIIFIDEPELSLHPDWQRRLFGILTTQQPGNQFFAATHSPFIYSKYPDREFRLREDRGE